MRGHVQVWSKPRRVKGGDDFFFRVVSNNGRPIARSVRGVDTLADIYEVIRKCNRAFDTKEQGLLECYTSRRNLKLRKQHRFRVWSPNGVDILAVSTEGYNNYADMMNAIDICAKACGVSVKRKTVPVHSA
jgi:uncharacterized protein YegP (UPF0339 family)